MRSASLLHSSLCSGVDVVQKNGSRAGGINSLAQPDWALPGTGTPQTSASSTHTAPLQIDEVNSIAWLSRPAARYSAMSLILPLVENASLDRSGAPKTKRDYGDGFLNYRSNH